MSCWCGHGPWHHWGYGPDYGYGPPHGYGPGYGPPPYGRRMRRQVRRWEPEEEDLREYLEDLEEEIGRVRDELEARRSGPAASE